MRSCMPLAALADDCLMAIFPDHRVQPITDHDLSVRLQHVAQPSGGPRAVATTARLQQAARAAPPPTDVNAVPRTSSIVGRLCAKHWTRRGVGDTARWTGARYARGSHARQRRIAASRWKRFGRASFVKAAGHCL